MRSGTKITKVWGEGGGKFANSRRIRLLNEDKSSQQAPSDLDVRASCARADEYEGSHLIEAKNETKENSVAREWRAPPNC